MGAFNSRQNAAIEEAEQISSHAYKYPPRSGNFFGSHFIMGGERFDTPQPEAYLFGENADLNFLGNRPTAFPYPPPQANEPTKTLKSLVNIRKESVRFVRVQEKHSDVDASVCIGGNVGSVGGGGGGGGDADENGTAPERTKSQAYNVEFIFDSDAKCAITIYYFCTEEVSPSGVTLVPRDGLTSETYHYEKGMNQYFSQPTHIFNSKLIPEDDFIYNPAKEQYPVAIHCVVEEGNEECRQSHTTVCVIDHHSDCSFVLRALKQKIFVDGLCYLLQEIYGIENKGVNKSTLDEDLDDHGSECVICMSETRDTLILPCRHLCLCNSCADSLRYQANNCPICRAPFRALLQIRAVQKGVSSNILQQSVPAEPVCDQHIPSGYIPVSLIEALNGPPQYVARTRDITDSVTTAGNIAIDTVNHKTTSPHKSNSQRRSKNKKHVTSVVAVTSATEATHHNKNETCPNTVTAKNTQNHSLTTATTAITNSEVLTTVAEGNGNEYIQNKSPKSDGKVESNKLNSRHSQDKLQIVNERNSLKLPKNKRQSGSNLSINNNSSTPHGADDDSENEKLSPLLSPLTSKNQMQSTKVTKSKTNEGVEESSMIDDVDSSEEVENDKVYGTLQQHKRPALTNTETSVVDKTNQVAINADDSDYYTPEDTQNSILSPLCPDRAKSAGDKLGGNPSKSGNINFKGANNLAMKHLHKKSTSVGNIVGPSAGIVSGSGSAVSELKGNVSSLPDMLDVPIESAAGGNSASTRSSSDSYSSSSSTKQLLSSNPPPSAAANIIVDDKTVVQNAVNV